MYERRDYARWYIALLLFLLMPQASVSAEPPAVKYLTNFSEGLHAPIRIALDAEGNAYVTEPRKHRVSVLDASGNLLRTIYEVLNPLGIAVDRSGRLYVGDSKTGSVFLFAPDGSRTGTLGSGAGQFTMPTDIAIDAQDRIYVVDSKENCVKVFDERGIFEFQFGDAQLTFPTGIAIDEARDAVLVGQYGALVGDRNAAKIQLFDREGNWQSSIGQFGAETGQFTRIQGLAVDGLGRIYVTDCFQSTVQAVDYTGEGLAFIGKYGTRPGQLNIPSDVALDRYNRLWVTSTENGRIEMFGIDTFSWPDGTSAETHVASSETELETLPKESALLPSYPNPSNPGAHIPFRLSRDAEVIFEIRNITGQLIRTLGLGRKTAGSYVHQQAAYWDGTNHAGKAVTSGVYFCTMRADAFTATRRMLILR